MPHTAVILIALGGPRSLDEVGQFLSAFTGRPAPQPVIATVTERYKQIGNKSPLPEIVKAQAAALEKELGNSFRVYESFRYTEPTLGESFHKAVTDGARTVIGLSMSSYETAVTTGAYRNAWNELQDIGIKKIFIPRWHANQFFIKAWQEIMLDGLKKFSDDERKDVVAIFTSHSIPMKYITAGDPYQKQIEETVRLVADGLNLKNTRVAWQSKGARATEPWLEPDVETTLDEIAQDGCKAVLEVPIGFTCDHLETLYDIDIVHRAHAHKVGLRFVRAESLNTSPMFIKALAAVVRES